MVNGRCVLSKFYSAALPILDQEVDDVDPKKTAMTAKDFLLFGYYGGLVYTGEQHDGASNIWYHYMSVAPFSRHTNALQFGVSHAVGVKNYSKALNMFLYTLTAPTMVVNAITMAAYKRYVLVSLIHAGGAP